jgi:hypothetical protein
VHGACVWRCRKSRYRGGRSAAACRLGWRAVALFGLDDALDLRIGGQRLRSERHLDARGIDGDLPVRHVRADALLAGDRRRQVEPILGDGVDGDRRVGGGLRAVGEVHVPVEIGTFETAEPRRRLDVEPLRPRSTIDGSGVLRRRACLAVVHVSVE